MAGALALTSLALPAQQRGVDVQSYHFRIEVPDTGTAIRGEATIRFTTSRGYDDTLRLDLVAMQVARVLDATTRKQLPFAYDGSVIRIAIAQAPSRDAELGVVVDYSGAPRDGLIIRTNARGHRSAFGDNWPNRARYWLPTVDHPSDKARVSWEVHVPAGWRVIENDSMATPIPTYTMVFGATQMTVSHHRAARSGSDSVPITVWTFPEDSAFADSVPFARATEIVETMSRIVGPYPFPSLAHVESSTRYGGMENATAIFYAEKAYVARSMREGVVRHETAHQWFGDAVTPRRWADLWLSEGFASYFDLVVGAAMHGDSVLTNGMRDDAKEWMASSVIARTTVDTLERDPNQLLNANVYPKGAWVLHMLRGQVGDSAFFQGIREYYRRYRDSSVVTAQFQAVMERASGQELGWFFHQWLEQPGCPAVDVQWSFDASRHLARVAVRQIQSAAWGSYRLPQLPIRFALSGGAHVARTIDVEPDRAVTVVEYELTGAPPVSLAVDPDETLLRYAIVSP